MKESYMGSCEKQTTLSVLYFLYVISFSLLQFWAKSKGSIKWHVLDVLQVPAAPNQRPP